MRQAVEPDVHRPARKVGAMTSPGEAFGPRLRALRVANGLSLSEFARRVFYSKGHVSRIETGAQMPSVHFARQCDAALEANGALAALVPEKDSTSTADSMADDQGPDQEGVWVMTMAPDGGVGFTTIGRRSVLLGGAVLASGLMATTAAPHRRQASNIGDQIGQHREMLNAARRLGQVAPPATILPMLIAQTQALRVLASDVRGSDATAVHTLMLRAAEFAGWMAQELGDTKQAREWIGWAAAVATEVDDGEAATYSLVRHAQVAMYEDDRRSVVELAKAAQVRTMPHRIMGLAAQREAQGHAMTGDYSACMRALDRATRSLALAHAEADDEPTIGTSNVPDVATAVRGWCLYDLGRPKESVDVLEREVARIPPTSVRARLRFGMRLALAHADAGNVEQSCRMAQEMVGQAAGIGSATVLQDVRRLSNSLRRWHSNPMVRALDPVFAAALYRG